MLFFADQNSNSIIRTVNFSVRPFASSRSLFSQKIDLSPQTIKGLFFGHFLFLQIRYVNERFSEVQWCGKMSSPMENIGFSTCGEILPRRLLPIQDAQIQNFDFNWFEYIHIWYFSAVSFVHKECRIIVGRCIIYWKGI